jgi:Nucleotidyltransferase
MSPNGDADLMIEARSALLDALEALDDLREAVIVIGAQAIYLHTGGAPVALAEATKDSDLALDPRRLPNEPLLEEAMRRAGFELNATSRQPGAWISARGIPVDLMVPESLGGSGGRRGARIPPHSPNSARRAAGLEACVVDHLSMTVTSLSSHDERRYVATVAGPAALLVAKLHKLGERQVDKPGRLQDKDAHDIYRLLIAVETVDLAAAITRLLRNPVSQDATSQAMSFLRTLFAEGPEALGSTMAGRAEQGVGEPATVSASVAFLGSDLLAALE